MPTAVAAAAAGTSLFLAAAPLLAFIMRLCPISSEGSPPLKREPNRANFLFCSIIQPDEIRFSA